MLTYIAILTKEVPTTVLEKLYRILIDRLHDHAPVEVDRTFLVSNFDGALKIIRKMRQEQLKC
jgi:hypothetical protein